MLILHDLLPGSCPTAKHAHWHPAVRELDTDEIARFELHLLRLDAGCRRLRFSSPVTDDYIRAYVASARGATSVILGCFVNGWLRGAAELRSPQAGWGAEAEIAFSVERAWQGRGIGTALMEAVKAAARARGIGRLNLIYDSVNHRMAALAHKVAANIHRIDDECIANVNLPPDGAAAA